MEEIKCCWLFWDNTHVLCTTHSSCIPPQCSLFNCAPHRESSSLLILGEIPSVWHLLHFSERRMSSHLLAPHQHIQYSQPYTPPKHNTWIYSVKYRSLNICPRGAPIWYHCLWVHYTPHSHKAESMSSAGGQGKELDKGQFIHHSAFLSPYLPTGQSFPGTWRYQRKGEKSRRGLWSVINQRSELTHESGFVSDVSSFMKEIWAECCAALCKASNGATAPSWPSQYWLRRGSLTSWCSACCVWRCRGGSFTEIKVMTQQRSGILSRSTVYDKIKGTFCHGWFYTNGSVYK